MFIKRKKALKNLVQGPGVQKTFWLSNHTPGYSLMSCLGHIQYYGVQVNPAGSLHCKYQKKSILQIN